MSQAAKKDTKIKKDVKTPENSKVRKASSNRIRNYLLLIIAAGIIGLVITCIKFFGTEKVQRGASISIEFTYDGAAMNQTPSGELFSIDDIYRDAVLNVALERAGLSEKYSAEQIRANMVVNGSYPGDVISQIKDYDSLYDFSESRAVSINDYYPTIYTIKLYDEFDTSISESNLKKLVQAIADQYKEYFTSEYIYAFDMEAYDNLMVIDSYDFSQRVKILKLRLEMLKAYAKEMYEVDAAFRFEGKSFSDISLKCDEIENDTLNKTEASIMMNVLTTSSVRLRNQYEYEIKLLENEKNYKKTNLDEINNLIENYQMDGTLYIPSGDSMVKVESNSKQTYEALVDIKRELSEELVSIESEIGRYQTYLEDLKKTTYSSLSKNEIISDEISEINSKVVELEKSFSSMMKEYNGTIIDENAVEISSLRYTDSKLFSSSFIMAVIRNAGPICIIMIILCCLHGMLSEIKKYKKENSAV